MYRTTSAISARGHAPRGSERDDARPQGCSSSPGRLLRHGQLLESPGRHPSTPVASQEDAERAGRLLGPKASCPPERRAEDRFDDEGSAAVVHRQQHRSRIVRCADPPEPVRPETGDEANVRQRLHVLHQGGPPPDAAVADRRQADERRNGVPAVAQGVDHCRLLAREVGVRRLRNLDLQRIEALRASLRQRALHARDARRRAVDDGLPGPQRRGRTHEPVEDEVRCVREKDCILPAGRLALRAVGDDDRTATRRIRDGTPFRGDGEPRATVANESARVELVDEAASQVTQRSPSVDVRVQPGVGSIPGDPVQKSRRGFRSGPRVVGHRQAHCAEIPEIWPVSVPEPESSERFNVRSSEPSGRAPRRRSRTR